MPVTALSPRLNRRIRSDYTDPDAATALVTAASDLERVQAAIILCGKGDLTALRDAADLATLDWRDLLVNAGLANADWPQRLTAHFGAQ